MEIMNRAIIMHIISFSMNCHSISFSSYLILISLIHFFFHFMVRNHKIHWSIFNNYSQEYSLLFAPRFFNLKVKQLLIGYSFKAKSKVLLLSNAFKYRKKSGERDLDSPQLLAKKLHHNMICTSLMPNEYFYQVLLK